MINPAKVLSALKQRHQFIMNHPELLPFINDVLTNSTVGGTEISIAVKESSGEERKMEMMLKESDAPFFEQVQGIFNDTRRL